MASTLESPAVKQRAAASGVAVTIGTATIIIDMVPGSVPNKDKDASFHNLCTECTAPTRLRQQLVCPTDGTHVQNADKPKKGKEIDGKVVEVSLEEVARVKGTDPEAENDGPKALNLTPVRMADVMEATLPGGAVYRLRPNKKLTSKDAYSLLALLVTRAMKNGKVLLGNLSIRDGGPKLFWVGMRRGQVVAFELLRPSDVAAFDVVPDVEQPEKVKELADELIAKLTVPFDADQWGNKVRERALELVAEKAANPDTPLASVTPISKPNNTGEVDVEALLGSMLAS